MSKFDILVEAQRTRWIESLKFVEFLKPINECRLNTNFAFFGEGWEIYIAILTIPCYNCDNSWANSESYQSSLTTSIDWLSDWQARQWSDFGLTKIGNPSLVKHLTNSTSDPPFSDTILFYLQDSVNSQQVQLIQTLTGRQLQRARILKMSKRSTPP